MQKAKRNWNQNSPTLDIYNKARALLRLRISTNCWIVALIYAFTTSGTTSAQVNTGQFSYGPLNPEYIRDAFDRNTDMFESGEDFEHIPAHSLYGTIFGNILISGDEYKQRFSKSDWETIQTLPSHNDATILGPLLQSQKAACYAFENPKATDTTFDQQLSLYVESASLANAALDQHYLNILESLSQEGRNYIAAVSDNFRKNNLLTFSRLDIKSLGEEIPEYVEQMIESRCNEISTVDPSQLNTGLLLKDNVLTESEDFRR